MDKYLQPIIYGMLASMFILFNQQIDYYEEWHW